MIINSSTVLSGTVQKIIPSRDPLEVEKAQIEIRTADHLYREIRIENKLVDQKGGVARLKKGGIVKVTVDAPPEATTLSKA
jgi:hypothetical protein